MKTFTTTNLDNELLSDAFEELIEQQDAFEQLIFSLEGKPHDNETVRKIFRIVHNIKGNFGLCGITPLIEVIHHLEDIINLLREKTINYHHAIGDIGLLILDTCKQFLDVCRSAEKLEYDDQLYHQITRLLADVKSERSPELFEAIALLDPSVNYEHVEIDENEYLDRNEDLRFFKELMVAIEKRNNYWSGRGERLVQLALAINHASGNKVDNDQLIAAIYVHDISMAFLPLSILQRKDLLSEKEKELVRTHVHPGYQLLMQNEFWHDAAIFVLQHHEKVNGTGYPNGLREQDISDGAKILAIVDAFDAITHGIASSQRQKRPLMRAIMEITRNSGRQFSEEYVNHFLTVAK
jgi:HD-GYP domain-containing protein (c-di-GMP phosphodiesterase class II)